MRDKTNSPDEILDLVDKNDKVIGQVVRLQADNNPFFTIRQSTVLIYDDQNRLLLQRRSAMKKVNPQYWAVTAAGHVVKGTTPEHNAHKELKEEAGFDCKLVFVEKEYIRHKFNSYFAYKYIGRYQGQQIVMNTEEVEDIHFVDKEEFEIMIALGMPFGKGSLKFIENFWSGKFDKYKS